MHILLTRPLEDCSEMILKFKSLGHQVSHLPLLVVEKVNYDSVNFLSFGGIIFTSANAIKFLDLKSIDKKILCFCVGEATEKTARNNGFQNVIAAEGNVENLKELILQNFDKKDGSLIYISGETVSTDLDQQLLKVGYNVKRIINYRTSHNKNFNEEFVKELKQKMPDIVYVYSQNSAASFLNYIKLQQLESCG
jgi:uroporphyrinogen-III synthase